MLIPFSKNQIINRENKKLRFNEQLIYFSILKTKISILVHMKTTKSEIKIEVEVDANRIPERLLWSAEEGKIEKKESKAMMLSVWDHEKQETLRIDLWTKDMPVDEMKVFFHQTLVGMRNTFEKATQDEKMGATMQDFCDYFAEKLELNKK